MITFEINEIADRAPCDPGIEAARVLFEPGRRYTLRQVLDAGLQQGPVIWLLIAKAGRDREGFARLQRWAEAVAGKSGPTVKLCLDAVAASRVERVGALVKAGTDRAEAKATVWAADYDEMIKAFR